MKRVIVGAALCGAALALAAGANAANNNYDFLYGSTDALVLGPTGIPTPSANYISNGIDLYLEPLGYGGTDASTVALTIPNSWDFFDSVTQGQTILVDAILADYAAGEMGCDSSGVCTDPLTIFTYSQSSLIASYAQEQLAEAGVPSDALRFVMLGANPDAVPTDLYPTEVFNIQGDAFAASLGQSWIDLLFGNTNWQELLYGLALHQTYLGLTAEQIASATSVVDGMTTFNEIPMLTTAELWQALFSAFFNV
ncbi:PE-PPE domain-containing protein [Mycolicibacter longobardus]|uniref:PE family protein n=1 Tax=Mycolicibacter longobardus TaxID=1108812 RepID=A0A1X1YMB8_9MYCO|nr:PE-PPE domain-containing protein [Mycolicibacter longobardus]MCV7385336.1 PE-PPE domain-containing protein [Mycolicibacter longobardus]ORW12279.1 PE family protein [Mycolicibacter longobardus]